MLSKKEMNLPAYTTADNLAKLADALRNKNNNEEDAKPLFGLGEWAFGNAKSAMRIFGLIKEGDASFTDSGREFAFGDSDDKKRVFKKILSTFSPYESLLNACLNGKQMQQDTSIEFITSFWGKFNLGSTERNRKEAASLFYSIIELVGYGKFTRGRGDNPSRIIWANNAKEEFIASTSMELNPSIELESEQQDEEVLNTIEEIEEVKSDKVLGNYEIDSKSEMPSQPMNKSTIIIKVDMTSWDDEKIRNFFKYTNGDFE